MYASLEDAWQDPLLVPSDRGFVLHPRHRPAFLAPSTDPEYEVPAPPAAVPRSYMPRVRGPVEEGFHGEAPPRNAYGWSARAAEPHSGRDDEVLRELRRLREELEWVRQDRQDLQRRLDFVCALLLGFAVLLLSDMIRRWTPSK